MALHSFLRKHDVKTRVINPIQSDAFRNLYIRQTKNDTKDAFLIAEVLRFGRYTTTELASDPIVALRQLSRFRFSLVDTISYLKRQVISILDMLFPEYERLFSDLFGKTSYKLLMEYTTPEEILAVDTNLVTIPGIGPILATAILGEIGDISRFPTGVKLVADRSYCTSVRRISR